MLSIENNIDDFIPFDQSPELIAKLQRSSHETLVEIFEKHGGLCELVCNRILIDGATSDIDDPSLVKKPITLERMDEDKIKKSHILSVYSVLRRIIAFLFGIYPNNIFSCCKQWKLVNKQENSTIRQVNRLILGNSLKKIENGETIKLAVFSKSGLSMKGHSLLIKKMQNDSYTFFDPNTGEHRNLSFIQLSNNIDAHLKLWKGTDIFLTRGKDYLKKLKVKAS